MDITYKLDNFEGPLDLLVHLIEKNKVNIYDIPINQITNQYIEYLNTMENINMNNISEFLSMSAYLLDIKSKMLLPKKEIEVIDDPRKDLVNKIIEYKKYKDISSSFKEREYNSKKVFKEKTDLSIKEEVINIEDLLHDISINDLYNAFKIAINNYENEKDNIRKDFKYIKKDIYNIKQKQEYILDMVYVIPQVSFKELFNEKSEKLEVIVTFLALLELVKSNTIKIIQSDIYSDITIFLVEKGDTNDEQRTAVNY